MRLAWLFVFALAVLAAAGNPAHAQCAAEDTGMLPNSACLGWPRVKIADSGGNLDEPGDPETFRFRLNAAACECSRQQNTTLDTDLYYELTLSNSIGTSLPGKVFAGSSCQTDSTTRDLQCHEIVSAAIADVDTLSQLGEHLIRVPLYDLINASKDLQALDEMGNRKACLVANAGTAQAWVIVDTDTNGDPDFFSPRDIDLNKFPEDVAGFDTSPPPPLENLQATGSEGSIEVTWDLPAANQDDFFAFQAFCMDDASAPVSGGDTPLFSTTQTLCGIPFTQQFNEITVDDPEESTVGLPTEFGNLQQEFICGSIQSQTATSIRIEGLENNRKYRVALLAIDRYGNATGAFFNKTVTPKPVTDLWEDIHSRGGKVEGGFCSAGGSAALPGLLLPLAFVWLWRRRRRRLSVLAVAASVMLVPSLSRADDFTPYWEDPSTSTESGASFEEDNIKWHVGIKVGPYTPDIDGQLGVDPTTGIGPYQAMFGNYYTEDAMTGELVAHDAHVYQILPMLDIDRVVWSRSGQVAVGGTIGYMQKTAFAYKDGTSASELFRPRSEASKNKFRLIPFALTATYRATQLDDLWGIPVVPYVRGGLAYYIWQMKGPSGDTSEICKDGSPDTSSCGATNKARGGTLGVVGSIGLSIRAERVDRDAAKSMRAGGIYHAGFYAELTAGIVNGFGSDKKLSVGDKTWFAGFDFEF